MFTVDVKQQYNQPINLLGKKSCMHFNSLYIYLYESELFIPVIQVHLICPVLNEIHFIKIVFVIYLFQCGEKAVRTEINMFQKCRSTLAVPETLP